MFGLDEWIASASSGATIAVVIAVAVLLGLRHATDPDHLAAVSTLIASGRERAARAAAYLGAAWGAGHATSLFLFGLPIVLFKAYLPDRVQQGAETAVGLLIIGLAAWLLIRWRRGIFHLHVHTHDHGLHAHGHSHGGESPHPHTIRARSPLGAYAIGLVHGMGGSAGVGVLLLASIHDRALAVGSLAVFALFTAVSMALLSTGLGATLSQPAVRNSFARVAPVIGVFSLAFGVWYALGALDVAPYVF